jgi:hypothetical protein
MQGELILVDFRYHLVSIVAVFLALALGVVVGTTQLNGAVLDDLNGRVNGLTSDKRGLESTISDLHGQTGSDTKLIQALGPAAVAGQLTDRRIVLVSAPNAPSGLRDGVVPLLESAGATIATDVRLGPDLVDPAKGKVIEDALAKVASDGTARSGSPLEQAARLLASSLVAKDDDVPASEARSAVLKGLESADLVDVDGAIEAPGSLVVMLTGEPVKSTDQQGLRARLQALLTLASVFDDAGVGVVFVGPESSAEQDGALQALRQDNDLASRVSSVDRADSPQGRIATVFALREQADGGSGQYGIGPDNDGPLPQPLPR